MTRRPPRSRIEVCLSEQRLRLWRADGAVQQFEVSTGRAGAGERWGSGCTPRGDHVVRARIGAGQPAGAVFVGRRPTGEVWSPQLHAQWPGRDWILTRILWLGGREPGRNRFGDVDSAKRYIYIHGTPPTEPMGRALSHGCIRMRDRDLLTVFEHAPAGTPVRIIENVDPTWAALETRAVSA